MSYHSAAVLSTAAAASISNCPLISRLSSPSPMLLPFKSSFLNFSSDQTLSLQFYPATMPPSLSFFSSTRNNKRLTVISMAPPKPPGKAKKGWGFVLSYLSLFSVFFWPLQNVVFLPKSSPLFFWVAVAGVIKLALEAGKATPSPPVGPALGSKGVNIMAFCKDYNARTADKAGYVIPVEITVYDVSSLLSFSSPFTNIFSLFYGIPLHFFFSHLSL